jgi:hypothetical protein
MNCEIFSQIQGIYAVFSFPVWLKLWQCTSVLYTQDKMYIFLPPNNLRLRENFRSALGAVSPVCWDHGTSTGGLGVAYGTVSFLAVLWLVDLTITANPYPRCLSTTHLSDHLLRRGEYTGLKDSACLAWALWPWDRSSVNDLLFFFPSQTVWKSGVTITSSTVLLSGWQTLSELNS